MAEPALKLHKPEGEIFERKPVKTNRSKKRIWRWTVFIVSLIILGCLLISVVVGWRLTHPARDSLDGTPATLGLSYENISFASEGDGTPLKGWWIPAAKPNKMTVIVAHGYKNNRLQENVPVMPLVAKLSSKGYHFLMFDFRNSGESGGELTTVGQFEQLDLLAAIRYAKERRSDKIVLLGYSMGASTALLAASQSPDVAAVIADSPFRSLEAYLEENLSYWSGLPRYPFTPIIMTVIPYFIGADASEVEPQAALDRIYPRPILFIHGTGDRAIPYENSVIMLDKHPDQFKLWITQDSGHVRSYTMYPTEYEEKVSTFLTQVLEKK